MIENLLTKIGLNCGTLKNFNSVIVRAMELGESQKWYFLTPLKVKDNGSGFKEVTVNIAFPIQCEIDDVTEADVLNRLAGYESEYSEQLVKFLKKYFLVPTYTFSIVPFWSDTKTERKELTDFGNVRIHVISGTLTLKYRETWFKCNCN